MTRAHVPPQCAGNTDAASRARWMLNQDTKTVTLGRPEIGGIHFLGQCGSCNSAAGTNFDPAYGFFADELRPLWLASLTYPAQERIALPPIRFAPGAVARSIVLGMCSSTSLIRKNWPQVDSLLDSNASIQLPAGWQLFLALTRGKTAWVAGGIGGTYLHGPRTRRSATGGPLTLMSMASVFFPPLAWQLVTNGAEFLVDDGWADVSEWLALPTRNTYDIRDFVTDLPMVKHPRHLPNGDREWIDFTQADVTSVIECFDVTNGTSDDAQARNRLMRRVMVPMDEVRNAAGRVLGLT